jgi:hypothetical protein
MNTDDSPSLSGQSTDNAPMISGKQGKALAKLRGAYHVGNLDALIRHMPPDQQAALHSAIVEQALQYAEPRLTHADEQHMVTLIRQWLDDHSDASIDALLEHVFGAGLLITPPNMMQYAQEGRRQRVHFSRSNMHRAHVIRDVMIVVMPANLPLSARTGASLAMHAMSTDFSGDFDFEAYNRDVQAEVAAAKRWQIEAAWAIIHNRPIPTIDGYVTDDPEGEYRAGRLDLLIAHMNDAQQIQFRQALVQQILYAIPPISALVSKPVRERWQTLIDAARRWLDTPTPENTIEVTGIAQLIDRTVAQSKPGILRNVLTLNLNELARRSVEEAAVKGAKQIAHAVASHPEKAALEIVQAENDFMLWEDSPLDDVESEEEYEALENAPIPPHVDRRRWQVEAAWAVLNDRPLPPLELEP